MEWRSLSRDSNLSTLDRHLYGRVYRTDQVLTLNFWLKSFQVANWSLYFSIEIILILTIPIFVVTSFLFEIEFHREILRCVYNRFWTNYFPSTGERGQKCQTYQRARAQTPPDSVRKENNMEKIPPLSFFFYRYLFLLRFSLLSYFLATKLPRDETQWSRIAKVAFFLSYLHMYHPTLAIFFLYFQGDLLPHLSLQGARGNAPLFLIFQSTSGSWSFRLTMCICRVYENTFVIDFASWYSKILSKYNLYLLITFFWYRPRSKSCTPIRFLEVLKNMDIERYHH